MTQLKNPLFAALAAVLALAPTGCSEKFVIHQPYDAVNVCSASVMAIAVNRSQKDYHKDYFPAFREAVKKRFARRMKLVDWDYVEGGQLNWDQAVAAGRKLGVDVVIGLLIDDSERPPKRMQILKVVKASNGKVIAMQNRLMSPERGYTFRSEMKGLSRVLSCVNK